MLRLTSIGLTNFGPFKGEQTIPLPEEDGVTVIYGENMRGKTSLLNAIRFGFFGRILSRGRSDTSLHRVGNWEAAAEGRHGFEVRLEMAHGGSNYVLVRTFKPKPGVGTPQSDGDYVRDYFLERNGVLLGPQQAKQELERILPEQISRFFLFDGELLLEYEELLVHESAIGPKISEAIERILGMPVLTNTRNSLTAAKERAASRHARAAQGDQKTRELGNNLASLQAERTALQADVDRQEGDLDALRQRKTALDEAMRKYQRVASLLDRRDDLAKAVKDAKGRLVTARERIGSPMSSAWCALAEQRVRSALGDLRAREAELHTALVRTQVLAGLTADGQSTCPACLQPVSGEAERRLHESLAQHGGSAGAAEEAELVGVRRQGAALQALVERSNPAALRLEWEAISREERDIYSKGNEIKAIEVQIGQVDDEDVRRTRSELESVIKEISLLEQGVVETRAVLHDNAVYRDNIQRKLDRLSGSSFDQEKRRRELATDLEALFARGIDVFREQLRRKVEADATAHFRKLTSEEDYASLRINDSYGLTIVHADGTDIPVRSAGAEHIVALSLVAALQNNAPLHGPIVIDSPFGRLDATHTRKTVAALPTMASQVIVLVYEDELSPERARDGLRENLRSEWTLVRRSARHTELQQRTN